jgi:hypothetical protein
MSYQGFPVNGPYNVQPAMSQAQIDALLPQQPGTQRYRLTRNGTIRIDQVIVHGIQPTLPSQLVWLTPIAAAGFGTLLELAP